MSIRSFFAGAKNILNRLSEPKTGDSPCPICGGPRTIMLASGRMFCKGTCGSNMRAEDNDLARLSCKDCGAHVSQVLADPGNDSLFSIKFGCGREIWWNCWTGEKDEVIPCQHVEEQAPEMAPTPPVNENAEPEAVWDENY